MSNSILALNCNPLVEKLQKSPEEFSKNDIIHFIKSAGIRHLNFQYPAGEGRLKTLNFIINNSSYLEEILSCGERVDGSSLFSFVEADSSDLYVVPRFSTAYLDSFSELPTLNLLCDFFNQDGEPLESSSSHTLRKACQAFRETTGLEFEAMGELEFYVIAPEPKLFPAADQHGYHESAPFSKFGQFRQLCMLHIAQAGGQIKYGHSEVGTFTLKGKIYEQNEIEFLPVKAEQAADQLLLAKWIIRNLACKFGYDLTFAPKISVGKAGSGMHIHFRLLRDGRNQMQQEDGQLSEVARRAIAGLMCLAPSLTAFGNTNPTSYLRLVPHQEAPTNICWGDRNRSTLVRVPLGWNRNQDLCAQANPRETGKIFDTSQKQTVEMRSPDGSANISLLLAGLAVACRHGFELPEALDIAQRTYVTVNIHKEENQSLRENLAVLPDSCAASADFLEQQRQIYEAHHVFSPALLDGIIGTLRAYNDATLSRDLAGDQERILALVEKYFHCG